MNSPAPRRGSESELSFTAKSQHSGFWPRLLDQSSPRSQDRGPMVLHGNCQNVSPRVCCLVSIDQVQEPNLSPWNSLDNPFIRPVRASASKNIMTSETPKYKRVGDTASIASTPASYQNSQVPTAFICAITSEIMRDPVVSAWLVFVLPFSLRCAATNMRRAWLLLGDVRRPNLRTRGHRGAHYELLVISWTVRVALGPSPTFLTPHHLLPPCLPMLHVLA